MFTWLTAVALHLFGYDLWFYASHRLLHLPALYWIHKEHHGAVYPTVADTYRGHWLETPLQSLGFGLPWLLGLGGGMGAAAAAAAIAQARGLARHDARTAWLIGNHHLLHHELFNVNYGEYWLDWLLGTADAAPQRRVAGWVRV